MASGSCIVVLVLGNFLGATVKGVTGFGSAILNLCVWVVCTCIGVNGGTLQQAVVSECLCSEALAVPLLFITNARTTCDWRLVTSLSIFGAVGAPIGAALLTNLRPCYVEFVMACVLLLVIILHCKVWQHIQTWCHSRTPKSSAGGGSSSMLELKQPAADNFTSIQPATDLACVSAAVDSAAHCVTAADELHTVESLEDTTSDTPQDEPCLTTRPSKHLFLEKADMVGLTSRTSSGHSIDAAACISLHHSSSSPVSQQQQQLAALAADPTAVDPGVAEHSDKQPLLRRRSSLGGAVRSSSMVHTAISMQAPKQHAAPLGMVANLRSNSRSCCVAVRDWWAYSTQPEQRIAIAKAFAIGSAAGTASGVMAGMTGMGGPPVMYMYDKLNVPKETVRGSNAVIGVLQFRIIAYALMGAVVRADVVMYVACSAAGIFGMIWGNRIAGNMNQQAFSRMMVFLMVLCCVLLFASAAGLAGK